MGRGTNGGKAGTGSSEKGKGKGKGSPGAGAQGRGPCSELDGAAVEIMRVRSDEER